MPYMLNRTVRLSIEPSVPFLDSRVVNTPLTRSFLHTSGKYTTSSPKNRFGPTLNPCALTIDDPFTTSIVSGTVMRHKGALDVIHIV